MSHHRLHDQRPEATTATTSAEDTPAASIIDQQSISSADATLQQCKSQSTISIRAERFNENEIYLRIRILERKIK